MAKKTQGTDLYAIDPDTGTLLAPGCITSIDGIDTAIEQIETTCLQDSARRYEAGLATPGTATFGINTDPEDPDHVRLHELKIAGTLIYRIDTKNRVYVIGGQDLSANRRRILNLEA